MSAQHRKLVLTKFAVIRALNAIHAPNMLNVEQYSIIQPVTVHLDGLEIHKFNVINVSFLVIFYTTELATVNSFIKPH